MAGIGDVKPLDPIRPTRRIDGNEDSNSRRRREEKSTPPQKSPPEGDDSDKPGVDEYA